MIQQYYPAPNSMPVVLGPEDHATMVRADTKVLRVVSTGRAGQRVVRVRRMKSYSESGMALERAARPAMRSRPYSAGDVTDLQRVTISGFSRNSKGTWMFKVDVGSDEYNSYAIRRRFTDFKELHDSLLPLDALGVLPELPNHGFLSVFQLLLSPDVTLKNRAEKLQKLLQCINEHPVLSTASPFKDFLGKNPSSMEVGYVSLSNYEAPASDSHLRLPRTERGRSE